MSSGLILAAGAGTRFGGTKQLADLRGRPLLEHALEAMTGALDRIVVVLGHEAELIRARVDFGRATRGRVDRAFARPSPRRAAVRVFRKRWRHSPVSLEPEEADAVQRLLERRGTTATDPNRHASLYRNYLGRIEPEDRDLIVPSLVDKLALIGTRRQLLERIAAMEKAGIDEIVIQPVVDPHTEMLELAELMN